MNWKAFIVRWPCACFFVLTFLVSWCVWIPAIRPLEGLRTFNVPIWAVVLLLAGGAGPSIAALIVTYAIGGKQGIKKALGDFVRWKVGWRWYAVVLLLWAIVYAAGAPVCAALNGQTFVFAPQQMLLLMPQYALSIFIALPTGPCLEELGWRGYALPQLQQRYSALSSALIVGVVWCLWHFPLFFVPGLALPGGETVLTAPITIVWTVLGTVGASIIFAWVYNNTHGSLLLAVLFHASLNAAPNALRPILYPDAPGEMITIISRTHVVLTCLVAAGLVVVFGPRHLSRVAPNWLDESLRFVPFKQHAGESA